jgi:integrase
VGVAEAIAFLAHLADTDDRDAELFETLIGTGLRKGGCSALRWSDLDLTRRIAHVRQTLSSIDNAWLIFTAPTTRGSAAGVGLSRRVIAAREHQRTRQDAERAEWGDAYIDHGLIFARADGQPLRPEYVLRRFRTLTGGGRAPPHPGARSPPPRGQFRGRGTAVHREQDAAPLHRVDHRRRRQPHDGRGPPRGDRRDGTPRRPRRRPPDGHPKRSPRPPPKPS